MQSTQRKTVAFTKGVLQRAQRRAKKMGIGFTDYVRFVVLTDLNKSESTEYMPTLSARTEEAVLEAEKEDAEGKLKTYTDVDEFFSEL